MRASRQRDPGQVGLWGAVAFLLAGMVALLTARSYALLSKSYPSRGGTVTLLNRAFGPGRVAGGLNVLLWVSYIVMLALYAQAFGAYAASFLPASAQSLWKHVFLSAALVALAVLNVVGASTVARADGSSSRSRCDPAAVRGGRSDRDLSVASRADTLEPNRSP